MPRFERFAFLCFPRGPPEGFRNVLLGHPFDISMARPRTDEKTHAIPVNDWCSVGEIPRLHDLNHQVNLSAGRMRATAPAVALPDCKLLCQPLPEAAPLQSSP
jgi:hypothetical protein